jgi:hypothetical protein
LVCRPVRAKSSSGGMRSPAGRLRRRAAIEPGDSRRERLAALPDEESGFSDARDADGARRARRLHGFSSGGEGRLFEGTGVVLGSSGEPAGWGEVAGNG